MSNVKQWRSLTQNLRKVLDELPSQSEREESVRAINELISVLNQMGSTFGAMPTAEEASKARECLVKLENIVNRNPFLRAGSNGRKAKPQAQNGSRPPKTEVLFPEEIITQTIVDLSVMTEVTMRSELEDVKRYSNSFLKAMLNHLGRRAPSRGVKSEMVDEIVATLINRRTLEGISGRQRL